MGGMGGSGREIENGENGDEHSFLFHCLFRTTVVPTKNGQQHVPSPPPTTAVAGVGHFCAGPFVLAPFVRPILKQWRECGCV
jgi:hypothetical protein